MKAIGIILAGGNNDKLGALTTRRALSAIPVGSCYRSIDFTLSNMSNSGIGKIAVITQYNSRSLHDHMSSAKWWDMGRKQGGLFVFSPYLSNDNSLWFRGTADSIFQNITFLKRSIEPYVLIASGDAVYKMDYNDVIEQHEQTQADITVMYKNVEDEDVCNYGVLELDETGRLLEFEEKPLETHLRHISMGIYVISRTLLINLLETIVGEGRYDIVKDIIIRYRKKLNIRGYLFSGYWRAVNGIPEYFGINMDFLKKEVRNLFTAAEPYIETKPKDEPPVKYNYTASVRDSLIGSGGIINGTVNHSVLFRKVYTGENSCINNSIIMEGTIVATNCYVEYAIVDKEAVLSDGRRITGTREQPIIVPKGAVV
ncbi:MAG: glucose-1-phosphate adenylyltransferase subunit GlgD [Clostridiales bacterium]|jgi:glucose-1-phosphate adenylyltransferase|nr:glucose-1-phosphate adenylyltransferase subunit GlgD [Clostridiales bacterium]